MTLDRNLGYTTQNEIGGASFFHQNVSKPANVYTPLFNISQGVPAFVDPDAAERRDPNLGFLTFGPPHADGVSLQLPQPLHAELEHQHSARIQEGLPVGDWTTSACTTWASAGTINLDSRPYGTGIDPNGNVIDLTQQANWAYRNTWVSNSSGVNGTQAYKPYPNWAASTMQCNCVSMIYHSGTIKVQKRYSYGLTFPDVRHVAEGHSELHRVNIYQAISDRPGGNGHRPRSIASSAP